MTDRSTSTVRPASASLINSTGRRTAWTSLFLIDSRNDPNLTPVWSVMKSMHAPSLAVSRPRPAKKAANRSSTIWWRRTVPSALPASRNTDKTWLMAALTSVSPMRITSAFGSGMNREAILRRYLPRPASSTSQRRPAG